MPHKPVMAILGLPFNLIMPASPVYASKEKALVTAVSYVCMYKPILWYSFQSYLKTTRNKLFPMLVIRQIHIEGCSLYDIYS